MDFEDRLETWRANAKAICEVFTGRYSSGGTGTDYCRIAERWRDALCRTDLDPNELRAVIAEAEPYEFQSDVAFFGFINSMRSIYHDIWEWSLSPGLGRSR